MTSGLVGALCGSILCGVSQAQFSTILNVPPDVPPDMIFADTQVSVFDGGVISPVFIGEVGAPNENLEVNLLGGALSATQVFGGVVNLESGTIGTANTDFRIWDGSELNVTGGLVSSNVISKNAVVNAHGGTFDGLLRLESTQLSIHGSDVSSLQAKSGSLIELASGSLSSFGLIDSDLTMTGGVFGKSSLGFGSTITVTGGRMGAQLRVGNESDLIVSGGSVGRGVDLLTGGTMRIVGSDFRLNGREVEGFAGANNSVNVQIPNQYQLSGTLADGTPFLFSSLRGSSLQNGAVYLESVEPTPLATTTFAVSDDSTLGGVGRNQTANVVSGGVLPQDFYAGRGGSLTVQDDGLVSDFLAAVGGEIHVDGGRIGDYLHAYDGSDIRITKGQIGSNFLAADGTSVTMDGGSIGQGFTIEGSTFTLHGGNVGSHFYASESQVTIAGGLVERQLTSHGSDVTVTGGQLGSIHAVSGTQTISGGTMDILSASDDSVTNLKGGTVGNLTIREGASARIEGGRVGDAWLSDAAAVSVFGGDFALDGVEVEGLTSPGDVQTLVVPRGGVLSGVLSDGVPFRWSPNPSHGNLTIELQSSDLPSIPDGPIELPGTPAPLGVRRGQSVQVNESGRLPNYFIAVDGSKIEVAAGGSVGEGAEVWDSELRSEGVIDQDLNGYGSTFHIAGQLGDGAAFDASDVTLKDALAGGLAVRNGSRLEASQSQIRSVNAVDSNVILNGSQVVELVARFFNGEILPRDVTVDGSDVFETLSVNGGTFTLNNSTVGSQGRHNDGTQMTVTSGSAQITDSKIFRGMILDRADIDLVDSNVEQFSRVRESSLHVDNSEIDGLNLRTNSVVTMSNGRLGANHPVRVWDGAKLVMHAGRVDHLDVGLDGTVEIHSGNIGDGAFFDSGSTAVLSGGKYGSIQVGRVPEKLALVGRDFHLDGVAIDGLEMPGSEQLVDLQFSSTLTGTFANGTPFAFSRQDGDVLPRSMTIALSEPIAPGPTRIVASTDALPEGLSSGVLVVDRSGVLPERFGAGLGTEVTVHDGGIVGSDFEAVGSSVSIEGGIIGPGFDAFVGSNVTISGGLIGDRFNAHAGSVVELVGDQFLIDGQPIEGLTNLGDSLELDRRDGLLTGQLSDGMPFEFELNSASFIADLFHPEATLRLTLAESVLNCDFDNDGECLMGDVDALVRALGSPDLQFDVDGSGVVDSGDVDAWLFKAGARNTGQPYLAGDATLDGVVNQADLNLVGQNWQIEVSGWSNGDFNGDGIVDAMDLSHIGENWQMGQLLASPVSATVPEPGGAGIGSLVALLLIAWRRKFVH